MSADQTKELSLGQLLSRAGITQKKMVERATD
jgi:hypothetical protein